MTRTPPVRVYDRHGAGLWAFAAILAHTPSEAERLVVTAVTQPRASRRSFGGLVDSVLRGWHGYDLDVLMSEAAVPDRPATHDVFEAVGRLPDRQRAAIALCTAGQRTYRDAATTLGVTAGEMADLLGQALRSTKLSLAV